jgi:transposase
MSRAYSCDLRQRIVDAVGSGKSRRAATADFMVSVATAVRRKQRLDRTGSIEPSRRSRRVNSGKLGPLRDVIIAKVEAQPDITMPDLAAWLVEQHGVSADSSNLSNLLCRADVHQERDDWCKNRQPAMRESPGRLVFVDETSVTTNMTPLRGRSKRGARLHAEAPVGKWNTQTFIAGLRCDAITAPFVV